MNKDIFQEIQRRGVIAVLEITNTKDAVPVARALVEGGVTTIELALRTPAAMESISRILNDVPEMLVGIGTVIQAGQATKVKKLGAHFGLSPGFNPRILREAQDISFPMIPGISTASELEGAVEMGCKVLKFFPAEPLGGLRYLNSMAGPYNYLGLKFIPLGGVSLHNLSDWAKCKRVLAIGGTWIAKENIIEKQRFSEIAQNARDAMNVWNTIRV